MIESKGELKWCPFRTRKHFTGVMYGDVETTHFMPCMKEDCICYERCEYDDVVIENCYRDNIGYTTSWNKKSDNDVKKTYSKDYFEDMKQFANIILGKLGDVAEYYDDMSRTFKGSQEGSYGYRKKAIDEAMDIINAVLHLQLEAEEEEPEIDWSQVMVNTPILVRDSESEIWQKRYFAKYENGIVYAWAGGSTSWTETYTTSWKFAKLAEEEE